MYVPTVVGTVSEPLYFTVIFPKPTIPAFAVTVAPCAVPLYVLSVIV